MTFLDGTVGREGTIGIRWVEAGVAAEHRMTFPQQGIMLPQVSVVLRLRSSGVTCNLSYLIVYLQAKEHVWSHPHLKETAPVKGKRTLAVTGNVFRRLDIHE